MNFEPPFYSCRSSAQSCCKSGCILHTCSRNTTNSDIERQHFAHVLEKDEQFGYRTATLCTRVREIRRIRSSSGCTLHTWSRNTTNSELKRLHFAHVVEKYYKFGSTLHTCSRNTIRSKSWLWNLNYLCSASKSYFSIQTTS